MLSVCYDYAVVDDVCDFDVPGTTARIVGASPFELQGRNYWWLSEDVAGYILNVGRCKVRGDQSGRRKGVAGLYPLSCRDATTGVHSEDVTGTSWILNSSDKPKIPDPTSEQSARAAPPPPSRRRRLTPPPLLPLPSLLSPL